jgi:hypothetical protein
VRCLLRQRCSGFDRELLAETCSHIDATYNLISRPLWCCWLRPGLDSPRELGGLRCVQKLLRSFVQTEPFPAGAIRVLRLRRKLLSASSREAYYQVCAWMISLVIQKWTMHRPMRLRRADIVILHQHATGIQMVSPWSICKGCYARSSVITIFCSTRKYLCYSLTLVLLSATSLNQSNLTTSFQIHRSHYG